MDMFFAELLMEDVIFMGLNGPEHVVEQHADQAAVSVAEGRPPLGLAAWR